MTARYPGPLAQCVLTTSAAVITSCLAFSYRGPTTIQTFLIQPPCSLANSTRRCCPGCLGLSTTEYSLLLALPSLLAVPLVLWIGHIIDFLGLPFSVLLLTLITSIGAVIRALSVYTVDVHALSLVLLIGGDGLVGCAQNGSVAVREYIANRFFPPARRALILGLTTTLDFVVLGLTALVVPPVAAMYGVAAALWLLFSTSLGVALAAGGIVVVYRFSSDVVSLEAEMKHVRGKQGKEKVLAGLAAFPVDFWIIVLACGCFFGAHFTIMSNMQLLQTSLYEDTSIHAAKNVAAGYLAVALSLVASGVLLNFVAVHWPVAFYGSVVSILGCVLMLGKVAFPTISNLLIGSGYGTTYVSLKTLYGLFVPPGSLGRAATLILAARLASIAALSLVVGALMQRERVVDSIWTVILFLAVFAVAGMTVVLLLLKKLCPSASGGETEGLIGAEHLEEK